MGLLSWLFPSDEDRLQKADDLLAAGEFAAARDEVQGIETERAEGIRAQARSGLKDLNIEEAIASARTGAFSRAREHLQLAASFADGRDPAVMAGRRTVRELRVAAKANEKPPTGLALARDLPLDHVDADEVDPIFSLPPDDPRVRYAMLMEAYPEDLRARLVPLGGDLASAVLLIDDGRPQQAVAALSALVEKEPAVRYERARAAHAAGNLALASSDLAAFGGVFGHRRIGTMHTGSFLVQLLLAQRRPQDALIAAEAGLEQNPDDLAMNASRAYALEANGHWAEADELARELLRKAPRDLALYRLMARCRLRAGKRMEAAQVLERSLDRNCKTGKCGCQPFDVEAGRMLARIYLEDRIEPDRAAELLLLVRANARRPTAMDAYLEALTLRNQGDPGAGALALRALNSLPTNAPLRKAVATSFPALTDRGAPALTMDP